MSRSYTTRCSSWASGAARAAASGLGRPALVCSTTQQRSPVTQMTWFWSRSACRRRRLLVAGAASIRSARDSTGSPWQMWAHRQLLQCCLCCWPSGVAVRCSQSSPGPHHLPAGRATTGVDLLLLGLALMAAGVPPASQAWPFAVHGWMHHRRAPAAHARMCLLIGHSGSMSNDGTAMCHSSMHASACYAATCYPPP